MCTICPPYSNLLCVFFSALEEHTFTACEGEFRFLTCPFDTVIMVESTFYGRADNITCQHDTAMIDLNCSSAHILDDVTEICGSRVNCDLEVIASVLGDPCPGTYKYLTMTYQCVSE